MMPFVSASAQTGDLESLLPVSDKSCEDSAPQCNNSRTIYHPKLATSLHSLKILQARKDSWMSGRTKKVLFLLLCMFCFGWIILASLGNLCQDSRPFCILSVFKSSSEISKHQYQLIEKLGRPLSLSLGNANLPTFEDVVSKDFMFDIEDHDVMVFLHIQKTGGTTFGKHLVNDLELQRDCVCHRKIKKRCTCLRPGLNSKETWLFSRYSTGWKCGLHADWTELTGCVDEVMDKIDDTLNSIKRRYFYITYLRHPVARYLSEYKHVRRGATWKNARLFCRGHSATKEQVPPCFHDEDWTDVTLKEFMSCPSNLANNRQTRMLADLTLVDCYNTNTMTIEERNTVMLASAKRNLQQMSFFGLTEHQEQSQYMFEETFNLKFTVRFEQYNHTVADRSSQKIDFRVLKKIEELNNLDLELYEFAENLLKQRYQQLKSSDAHFADHFLNMGSVSNNIDEEI